MRVIMVVLSDSLIKTCRCGSSDIPEHRAKRKNWVCRYCDNLHRAKSRAKVHCKNKGLPFDHTLYTFLQNTFHLVKSCPLCSRNVKANNLTLTIDRIDSSKGYVSGNMQVICWDCNNIKGTFNKAFWDSLPPDYIERLKQASA